MKDKIVLQIYDTWGGWFYYTPRKINLIKEKQETGETNG